MQVVVIIHIFNGSVETYATIGCLCKSKGWSDSSFRKKSKDHTSFVYNDYRIEITELRDDRRAENGVYRPLLKK